MGSKSGYLLLVVAAIAALALAWGQAVAAEVEVSLDLTAGTTLSNTATVTAHASSDAGIAEVSFAVDGTDVGKDTSTPYECAWDTLSVDDGEHTITASAKDLDGKTNKAEVKITVNNDIAKGVEFHTKAAEDALAAGKNSDAILAARKAVKANAENAAAQAILGKAYYAAKQLDGA